MGLRKISPPHLQIQLFRSVGQSQMSLLPELLLTVLFGTQASFTHPGVILPQKESLGDLELKAIVKKSQRSREARYILLCVKSGFTEWITL